MQYPNWFAQTAQENFSRHLAEFKGKPVKFLQVGAYTGDASKWMLEEILSHPDSTLMDVDTWAGSDEEVHKQLDWNDVKRTYLSKVEAFDNVEWFSGTSDEFFSRNEDTFDFIYIDGDHTAFGVMKDLINSFNCLNDGGILGCDDYQWSEGNGNFYEPRPAIDAFFNMTRDKVQVIELGWQVWFKKI